MRLSQTLLLAGGSALAALSTPAAAAIVLANPSTFNGEVIVFNRPGTITNGSQILGFTNQSGTGYHFEGTTISGPGGTVGTRLEGSGGIGQAVVTAEGYSTNQYPRLTSLTYYRQDGGTFNDTEFKFEDIEQFVRNQAIQVQLFAWNQNNVMTDLGFLTLGGDNRFGIQGTGSDVISRVQYVVTGGAIGRHKQTRVDQVAAVPEPATWLTMILGFGAVGAFMRRSGRAPSRRLSFRGAF